MKKLFAILSALLVFAGVKAQTTNASKEVTPAPTKTNKAAATNVNDKAIKLDHKGDGAAKGAVTLKENSKAAIKWDKNSIKKTATHKR